MPATLVFPINGGVRSLFWFCSFGATAMAVMGSSTHDWLLAAMGAVSLAFIVLLLRALPRQIEIDDEGLTFGKRRVRFAEAKATWSGHGGVGAAGALVSAASDNWVVAITAPSVKGGITLSGPMFKEQSAVRQALESRLASR